MTDGPIRGVYLGPEGAPYEGGQLLHNLLLFGRLCKALGIQVTPHRMIEVAHALEHIQLGKKTDFYHTLRAMMVSRHRDFEMFDEAFNEFWQRPAENYMNLNLQSLGEKRRQKKTQFLPPVGSSPAEDDPSADSVPIDPSMLAIVPTFSQQEMIRYKDFAEMTGAELSEAQKLMAQLPKSLGFRRSRRFKSGQGRQINLRQLVRKNMRYFGEPIHIATRGPKLKPRPFILICDISGSMERYTRILLHFIHSLASTMFQVESFTFSTKLTRITRHIRHKSVDHALNEVGIQVKDWGGGTRTGDSLHEFNFQWGRRVLGRGAIVMLITDGWDRGDPDLLHREMERLGRSAYRLIWLNPLLAAPEYEPLTRGALAMLPHVDDFLPINNLASLEMLMEALEKLK